jgi:hypothetical protein
MRYQVATVTSYHIWKEAMQTTRIKITESRLHHTLRVLFADSAQTLIATVRGLKSRVLCTPSNVLLDVALPCVNAGLWEKGASAFTIDCCEV